MPKSPRCLIVDRSEAFRWSALRLLTSIGMQVVAVVGTATEARLVYSKCMPNFAIVEWRPRDGDVRRLIADLRAARPPATVIATLDADRRVHPDPIQWGVDVIADKARFYEALRPLLQQWNAT